MKVLTYIAKVTEGGEIKAPKRMRKEITESFRGKEIEFVVRRKKRIRSTEQNAYYWGVVVPYIVRGFIDLGNDLQEGSHPDAMLVHEYLKQRFIPGKQVADAHGEAHNLPPTTTILGTAEMADYITHCQQFAAEFLNVTIPEAGEQTELF